MGYYAPAVKKTTQPSVYGGYGKPATPQYGAEYVNLALRTQPGRQILSKQLGIPALATSTGYVAPTKTRRRTTSQPVVAGAGLITGGVTPEVPPRVTPGVTPYQSQMPEIDMAAIWNLSGQMADMEINPQLEELDRYLRDAGYTAEESNTAINQAYPIMKSEIQKSIFENQVTAQQNLASAGTLRGGAMGELGARGMEREAVGIEGLGQERSRQLETIRKRLGTITEGVGQQRVGLEARRGSLRNIYAENMRQRAFDEQMQRLQAQENIRQFNEQMALKREEMAQQLKIAGMGGGGGVATGFTPAQPTTTQPYNTTNYLSDIGAAGGNVLDLENALKAAGIQPSLDPNSTWQKLRGQYLGTTPYKTPYGGTMY